MKEKSIEAKSYSIKEFLEDSNSIIVPRYQREYSWEKNNIIQFLTDVKDEYYIGNVIVDYKNDIKEIVDGQQRIITTFLILIAIRNISEDEKIINQIDKLIFKDEKKLECKLDLKDRIGADGQTLIELIIDNSEDELKIFKKHNEAKNYQEIKKELMSSDNLEKIMNNLLNSRIVEVRFINNIASAHEMFVNLNTKGKPLENIEVIKSKLFKYLLKKPHSDVYKDKWQEMIQNIDKTNYNDFVSTVYLFYLFDRTDDEKKLVGTNKSYFLKLLDCIDDTSSEKIFNMMTGENKNEVYSIYFLLKKHELQNMIEKNYPDVSNSFSNLDSLWCLFKELGFEQSDIMFTSLFFNNKALISTYTTFIYDFMFYIFLYEVSRSIIKMSPAEYANEFRKMAFKIYKAKDPSKVKKELKKFVSSLNIDTKSLEDKLNDNSFFLEQYKMSKFIIMTVDENLTPNLKVEHFICKGTPNDTDKKYIGCLGNLIPVSHDHFKNKSVIEKIELYKNEASYNSSLKKFLEFGFDDSNYINKIEERKEDIIKKFVNKINETKDKILNS